MSTTLRNTGSQRIFVGPGPKSKRAEMGEAGHGFVLHAVNDTLADGSPANVKPMTPAVRKALEALSGMQALLKSKRYGLEFVG